VEKALDRVYVETDADGAVCVVQDPSTGEILALACRPDFDPNRYWEYPVANRRNRAVTDGYEPGSCLKVVPTTALLQERLIDPSELIYCEQGAMRFQGRIMHDYRPHGTLTFAEVISESSNIGTIKAATRLSEQQLYEYCKLFGFGQRTGLDFPGEGDGLLRPPAKWSGLSLASISIGQEILVSPVQLVRAFAAVANDGIMMRPLLMRQVEESDGSVIDRFEPRQQWRVMSRATAQKLKELLHKVVEDGSGGLASVKGYDVAGKTGTAQKVDPTTGLYYSDRHVAIFCGFVPVDKPRLSILVLVDSPRVKHDTGGAVAAPVFREIAEASLNYLRVPPDRPGTLCVKDEMNVPEPSGSATPAVAEAAARFEAMPDLTGMSKLKVIHALSFLQLELAFKGSGYVVEQSIEPGRLVMPGAQCKITFAKDGMPDEALRFTRAGGSAPR
jgi:cell division protein FtsI (penicillin-binding protein 3)